tara:strand:- start:453 stop:1442 length:990 start_codon:yes stop_codon:yes gene_type:complete
MGGDNAPLSNINGAIDFLKESNDKSIELFFVCDEKIILPLKEYYIDFINQIKIIHCEDVIGSNERSTKFHKTRPDSSLVRSINLIKDKKADAVISAGNTGALLTSSLFLLGKIPGISRPALAPFIPTQHGGFLLCDAGANVKIKPKHLVEFSLMCQVYLEQVYNCQNPKVGLLNIGTEKLKGNDLTIEGYSLIEQHIKNFHGNIEARNILDGLVDIVVCDGFTGNIILKTIEGVIEHTFDWLKLSIKSHFLSNIASPLMKPAFNDLKNNLDYEEHGGTSFLGINGIVFKSHGSSSSKGIKNTFHSAYNAHKNNILINISKRIESYSLDV